jgi:hypothetical protein
MIIGTRHMNINQIQSNCIQVKIGNNIIPFVNSAKNLGLIFDNKMSWNEHINNVNRNAYFTLYKLYKLGKFVPDSLQSKLIETLVYPTLDYCDICMCDLSSELNIKLQRIQISCVRYITGLKKYDHISAEYVKLKELNINERSDMHALSFI